MKINKTSILLSILISITACESPSVPEPPVSPFPIILLQIEGVVTDATTNLPIKDVSLRLFIPVVFEWQGPGQTLATALTDQDGYYYMYHHYSGGSNALLWLQANKRGYHEFVLTSFDRDEVHVLYTEELQGIDIKLKPYRWMF